MTHQFALVTFTPVRLLGGCLFGCLATQLVAQVPDLPAKASTTTAFVPAGYHVVREVVGHLNGDEYRDVVLILADVRESSHATPQDALPRLLLVLAGGSNGYRLDVATDRSVLGRVDGGAFGDPVEDLSLDRNVIVLSHYGGSAWRWRYVHRFRFDGIRYRLIARTTTSYFNAAYCERLKEYRPATYIDEDLVTGRRYRYDVSEQRCIKRERRSRFVPVAIDLATFDIRKDVENR